MNGVSPQKRVDGNLLVPARWLLVVVGTAMSCLGASLYLVFSTGSLTTRLTLGQELHGQRITAIESNREIWKSDYHKDQIDIVQRLTNVETQNKSILDSIRRIEDKL